MNWDRFEDKVTKEHPQVTVFKKRQVKLIQDIQEGSDIINHFLLTVDTHPRHTGRK